MGIFKTTVQKKNKDVFIAYSRKDYELSEEIEQDLENANIQCWRDLHSLEPGDVWYKEVRDAIHLCYVVLALFTHNSIRSKHFEKEVSLAFEAQKVIIPVFLEPGVEIPPNLEYIFTGKQKFLPGPGDDDGTDFSLEKIIPDLVTVIQKRITQYKNPPCFRDEEHILQQSESQFTWRPTEECFDLEIVKGSKGAAIIKWGAYELSSKEGASFRSTLKNIPLLTEFIVTARFRKIAGAHNQWFGFEFRAPNGEIFYQFLMSGDQTVRIGKHVGGEVKDLARHEHVYALRSGNDSNTLKVIRKADNYHIVANQLPALTVKDAAIGLGSIGLVVVGHVQVACSELTLIGIELEEIFNKAILHWHDLEMREASQLLEYIKKHDPTGEHLRSCRDLDEYLLEHRPDYRESILIVLGYRNFQQMNHLASALRLREIINRKGKHHALRWATITTDLGILEEQKFLRCPLILLGDNSANQITSLLEAGLPSEISPETENYFIRHDLDQEGSHKRVALGGHGLRATEKAVDTFISSGLLEEFLRKVWT